jgi:hypothetical protein
MMIFVCARVFGCGTFVVASMYKHVCMYECMQFRHSHKAEDGVLRHVHDVVELLVDGIALRLHIQGACCKATDSSRGL